MKPKLKETQGADPATQRRSSERIIDAHQEAVVEASQNPPPPLQTASLQSQAYDVYLSICMLKDLSAFFNV